MQNNVTIYVALAPTVDDKISKKIKQKKLIQMLKSTP